MAEITVSSSSNLAVELWQKEVIFRETLKESYFQKFMGKDLNSIVYEKTELEKTQGNKITLPYAPRLSGAVPSYRVSGQTVEGFEKDLSLYDYSLTLEEYVIAIKDSGPLSRKRTAFSLPDLMKSSLNNDGAELLDYLLMQRLITSPTTIFYTASGTLAYTATAATATAAVTSTDVLTPSLVSRIKTFAITGGNRSTLISPITPIKIEGKNYYVLLVHPDNLVDWRENAVWNQAAREALERGPDHPLFSGASYLWDGVVIHEHENVPITTNWGSGNTVAGSKCVFMGAGALALAWGERPKVVEKDFDYGRKKGYAYMMIMECGKPVFNSKDFGSIAVYVARTKTSDMSAS